MIDTYERYKGPGFNEQDIAPADNECKSDYKWISMGYEGVIEDGVLKLKFFTRREALHSLR